MASTRVSERGGVLAITVVIITALLACSAIALDLGGAWAAKRRLRTATDSAALAAAHEYAKGSSGCTSVDDNYVAFNDSGATVTGCTYTAPSGVDPGRVTISAKRTVSFNFAKVVGISNTEVESTTTARYGGLSGASGLRPMGLCLNANPALTSWMNLPSGPTGDSGVIRIIYSKDHPDNCGSNAPGNWGMMDFNGGSNSNAETKEWVQNGYPAEVPLSPPTVPGDTGAFSNSISSELTSIIGKDFGLPVFNNVTGNGSNAQFTLIAFVKVELVDFKTTGSQSSRYLDLKFKKGVLAGGGCCANGINTGAVGIDICGVDEIVDPLNCRP